MSIRTVVEGELVTISVDGSFDVSVYDAFKAACKLNMTETNRFVIDMKEASYMDSSALGMLLLLREKTAGDRGRIKIINVGQSVQKVLEVAQFQQLFDIERA
ncbi:MAG: STAS domain-containing protein [Gammaproteobacteria bacterium]|nr:STAS domain-containing protein [Gammaproteobacteria bacterium]